MTAALPVIDPVGVQKFYDRYIEAFSSFQPERMADTFFTYPVVFGDRLIGSREHMAKLQKKIGDRMRDQNNYSHSVMTPVRVEPLGGSNCFILCSSGTRFRKDGSVLEEIPPEQANYLCAAVGGGEYKMLLMQPVTGKEQATSLGNNPLPTTTQMPPSSAALPAVDDLAAVQKFYDQYIEAFSSNDAERLADNFFTYPVVFGDRLVGSREHMAKLQKKIGDRLRDKDNYSHSVMTPVRVEPLVGSNCFLLYSSGTRFRKDGSVLERIERACYLCAAVGAGEYRMVHMNPLPPLLGAKL